MLLASESSLIVLQQLHNCRIACRRTFRNAKWPPFWQPTGPQGLHSYALRTLWALVPLPLSAPAIVNAHEARAFAAWRTFQDALHDAQRGDRAFRLLTEAEHRRLRDFARLHQHTHNHVAGDAAEQGADQTAASGCAVTANDGVSNTAPAGGELRRAGAENLQLAWGCEGPVHAFDGTERRDVPADGAAVGKRRDDGGRDGSAAKDVAAVPASNGYAAKTNGHSAAIGHATHGSNSSLNSDNSGKENGCVIESINHGKSAAQQQPEDANGKQQVINDHTISIADDGAAASAQVSAPTAAHPGPPDSSDSNSNFPAVVGNAWHWCEDWFAGLPSNRGVHPLYEDFSTPCYDGQHAMIMGGSFASTGDEASRCRFFNLPILSYNRCDSA